MRHTHASKLSIGIFALLASFAYPELAHAQQPSIASITGSTAPGSVMTIGGTNLNAETMQNWDNKFVRLPSAWSFEGASPTADGYVPGGNTTGVYDSSVKLLGNQSMKFRTTVSNPTCTVGVGQSYNYTGLDDAASANAFWVRVYVRFNRVSNFPTGFMKMLEGFGSGYYFQPNVGPTGANPSTWLAFHDGNNHVVNNPSGQIQNNRWFAVELHWSVSPRLYEAWVDGVKLYSGVPTQPGPINVLLFGVINACGTLSWDVEHWMDGLTVAHQRVYPSALVEVGDGPNYSTANKKVQALESIADDQITFRLDTSGLGSGPYYVWVRNNAQALSPAYFLTGGQVSGPTAPTNPRIVP